MENDKTNNRRGGRTRTSSCSSNSSSRHIANVTNYKSDEGKTKASFKWIVSRVYGDGYMPDGLRSLFFEDNDGKLQLSPQLVASLVNGSLYGQAASRIFRDSVISSSPQHGIGAVFSILSREGIDVRDADGNAIVEETLRQSNPFNLNAHLHMIDALMTAHLRSLVSIDKIVHAISNYTSVEKREEPLDCVDALLFWINKVCLLVRDDIEHNGLSGVDKLPTIPEMEDLYEDLCDGTCICALISFYRPDALPLREICFKDPMSVHDCRFNLELLCKFCSSSLPWDPFHFETEDILFLHESLQPNINVFLADLFQFFESHSLVPPTGSELLQQTQKQRPLKNMAEIRLQMEEMRRQLSLRQQVEMAKQEQRRYEATKDAFFKVVNKRTNNDLSQAQPSPISQHFVPSPLSPVTNAKMFPPSDAFAFHPPFPPHQTHNHSTPIQQHYVPSPLPPPINANAFSVPPFASHQSQFYGGIQMQSTPIQQHYMPSPFSPPTNARMFSPSDAFSIPPQFPSHQTQFYGGAFQLTEEPSAFRLHPANGLISRLDPQLDLSKDLTNWSQMTYRDGDRPQRKTWVQKQTEANKSTPTLNISSSGNGGPSVEGRTRGTHLSGDELAENSPQKGQQRILNQTFTKSSTKEYDSATLIAAVSNGSESLNNRSGGLVLEDVCDPNSEMTPEMQAKRRAILASQIRRKERIMARSEEKETEEMDRLQVKMQRMEQAEMRRMEREQRRQKLLEDYKKKKVEQELMPKPGSDRACVSSTISLNRGHSQPPPFGRPKSQSNMNLANVCGTLTKRACRAQSNVGNNNANAEQNGGGSSTARAVGVSSPVAEPSLKLYAKQPPKSNRGLIMNALQYSIFPGHVSNEQRQKVQAAIAQSDSKHFLVLFRDHQCQYRGLYTWDQFSDTVHKIEGLGPKVCREPMMTIMFKYDSGSKSFGRIQTKHLSATIDGFVIAEQYWQKPKIPHSGR
ncbi:hypothetical protein niasHS_002156 [Heterodera schachtii]|uniref:Patronin n=1 Tax=Heterodera schachtii TaxID=97005 RepID=A0ABD2KMF4_HETSC